MTALQTEQRQAYKAQAAKLQVDEAEPLVFNATEAARLLAVTVGTLQWLNRLGRLKAIKIGNNLRWTRRSLENYVAKLECEIEGGGHPDPPTTET